MKKLTAFLLAFMMFMGVLFIGISAEGTTDLSTDCSTCGGSYGEWTSFSTVICQLRYKRTCDSCGNSQVAKDIVATTVSYNTPAIGANTGDTVFLSLYSVYFDYNTLVSADQITWEYKENTITEFCTDVAGVYELTAKSGELTKTVYVIIKNPTDAEYVLFYDDFERDPNNDGNLDEIVSVTDSGYEIVQQPGNSTAQIQNGKLVLNTTGNKDHQMRVLLPKWIRAFGDYKIDTVFNMDKTVGNNISYWFAVMARVGEGSQNYPFWQAAVRQGAKDYVSNNKKTGVEIANKPNSKDGWSVPYKGSYTENLDPKTPYTLTFDIVGKRATHAINNLVIFNSVNVDYLKDPTTNEPVYTGRVGFHVRASQVSIDSVKITLPIEETSLHSFGDWTTVVAAGCTTNGIDSRACKYCDTKEERVIKGGHTIVKYSAKPSTCTEHGWAAYETCSNCDYTTYAGDIPALGHYFDREIHSIAHRGASSEAPENTIHAYIKAKELGYTYVECDIAFTKDGVAVLLHDDTIDRTSNGSGKISELTLEDLEQYDFATWDNNKWANTEYIGKTPILTFAKFIEYCSANGLHPYLELKDTATYTQANVNTLMDIVKSNNMEDNCTWISFNATYLKYVRNADDTARLGYLKSGLNQTVIDTAKGLRNGVNEVFLDIEYRYLNESTVTLAAANGFAIETWTVDTTATLNKLSKYISGFASNTLFAEDYLLTTSVTEPTCGAQGYTTYTCACGATKVADYVPATGNHTAKDGVCTECNAIVYCSDASHNLEIISISYANGYDKEGVKVVRCLDCDAKNTKTVANPLLACLGYSTPQDGRAGVAVSFKVDNDALNEYEAVTKKSISYGAFAVSQDNIEDNEIFDANGNLQDGVILADIANYKFNLFDIVIVGFDDDHMNSLFAMGAYIAVTDSDKTDYSYIQNEAPLVYAAYSFESYNSILSKMEGVE